MFSAHATGSSCAFSIRPAGARSRAIELPDCTDEVFHGYLPDAGPGILYGYRAHGPYQPEAGHRFNPYKLLLDPYARALSGGVRWNDALFGYRVGSPRGDLSLIDATALAAMPKSVVTDEVKPCVGRSSATTTPWQETVIYETHVRGFSMRCDDPEQYHRGTFAGAR